MPRWVDDGEAEYRKGKNAMGNRVQLSEEQAKNALVDALAAADEYNKLHNFTRMVVKPLVGGNVQIVVERVVQDGDA